MIRTHDYVLGSGYLKWKTCHLATQSSLSSGTDANRMRVSSFPPGNQSFRTWRCLTTCCHQCQLQSQISCAHVYNFCSSWPGMSDSAAVVGAGAGVGVGFLPGARYHTSAEVRDQRVYKDAVVAVLATSGCHKAFMDTCLEVSCGTDHQPSP